MPALRVQGTCTTLSLRPIGGRRDYRTPGAPCLPPPHPTNHVRYRPTLQHTLLLTLFCFCSVPASSKKTTQDQYTYPPNIPPRTHQISHPPPPNPHLPSLLKQPLDISPPVPARFHHKSPPGSPPRPKKKAKYFKTAGLCSPSLLVLQAIGPC